MISRRLFLKAAAWFTATGMACSAFASENHERVLNLYHLHTGERLTTVYYSAGMYNAEARVALDRLLRCHFTDEVAPIDVAVLDLLCDIKDRFGKGKQIEIVSGYRSPHYNAYLRNHGRRVARDSMHVRGRAIDFSIDGASSRDLARAAQGFCAGGVGRYPHFVHIDVGLVRYWS